MNDQEVELMEAISDTKRPDIARPLSQSKFCNCIREGSSDPVSYRSQNILIERVEGLRLFTQRSR